MRGFEASSAWLAPRDSPSTASSMGVEHVNHSLRGPPARRQEEQTLDALHGSAQNKDRTGERQGTVAAAKLIAEATSVKVVYEPMR